MARLHGHWVDGGPMSIQPESARILLIGVHLRFSFPCPGRGKLVLRAAGPRPPVGLVWAVWARRVWSLVA